LIEKSVKTFVPLCQIPPSCPRKRIPGAFSW
jgi:hypothetical protein